MRCCATAVVCLISRQPQCGMNTKRSPRVADYVAAIADPCSVAGVAEGRQIHQAAICSPAESVHEILSVFAHHLSALVDGVGNAPVGGKLNKASVGGPQEGPSAGIPA